MNTVEKWEDGKEFYTLRNGFTLQKADEAEFGIHYAIYSGNDQELSYSWNYIKHDADGDDCQRYWVMKGNRRLGGVVIEPNYLSNIFFEPPYTIDAYEILREIDYALMSWAKEGNHILIYPTNPEQLTILKKLGYRHSFTRKTMIRPTEKFDVDFGENFELKTPTLENKKEIAKVVNESYKGGIQYEEFSNNSVEDEEEICDMFLHRYMDTDTLNASTLVYDKSNNKLVAVCLAGKNKEDEFEFSKINDLVVLPAYRGQGLGEKLIKRTLTILHDISPATRLDVSVGNSAEGLYYKMGFYGATEWGEVHKKM